MSQRHPKRRRSRNEPSITPMEAKRSKDAANAWAVRVQADDVEADAVRLKDALGYGWYEGQMREVARLRSVADEMERSGNQMGGSR